MERTYINVHFDTVLGVQFVETLPKTVRRIGERYGSFVAQFRSARSARLAMQDYRARLVSWGIAKSTNYGAPETLYAVLGNYSALPVRCGLDDLERDTFYWTV